MRKKRFYTLYLTTRNQHLVKDEGMVPYYLSKLGYESHFVSFLERNPNDEFQKEVGSLIFHTLKRKKKLPSQPPLMMAYWEAFKFLLTHRKDIDVLNLYYIKHSILYGVFFKLIHPKGVLYLKMDMDPLQLEKEIKQRFHVIRKCIYKFYLHHIVDKVTAESLRGYNLLKSHYSLPDTKLMYMPNGIDDRYLEDAPVNAYTEKKNLIITVGRIGTYQKHTEMLLEACKSVKWKDDWELHLIGPISEPFKDKIRDFYRETSLENRVKFIGPIWDKKELFAYYNQSKVFCMTSRYESFGFVCVEAQAFGNWLLTTPIVTAPDFISEGEFGDYVHDAKELSQKISHIIENQHAYGVISDDIVNFARDKFRWSKLCMSLDRFLDKK